MRDEIELRYGTVAMLFHWVIAALLITNVALGLYFADLPPDPLKGELAQWHKSIGLTVLVLSILRLCWRLMHPAPPLPTNLHRGIRVAARASHYLFYFLIVVIPLSGWLMVSASPLGRPTVFFHWFNWPHIWFVADLTRQQKLAIRAPLENIHIVLAWSAIVLIPLHVAAALWHQFIRRDDLFWRMLPRRRARLEAVR